MRSKNRSELEKLREISEIVPPVGAAPSKATSGKSFKEHQAYRQIEIAIKAGEATGIASPFFRQGDAVRPTSLSLNGQWVTDFSSYDYLSLNLDQRIADATANAVKEWGVSSNASRLVGGQRRFHHDLEVKIAEVLGAESALAMVSGHATNHSIIRTLMGQNDLIAADRLAHNSVFEGIQSSGAEHISFPHNDWDWLDKKLAESRGDYKNVLIVLEGLYSMDGDIPDLERFVEIKRKYDTWLMVDEAHSLGVLGATGRGICEETGVARQDVDITMGTLSKSLCSCGGFVAGTHELIDILRFTAPGFVYSVGISAPNAAAALEALNILETEPERVRKLRAIGDHFKQAAIAHGLKVGDSAGFAVAPIMIEDSIRSVWVSNQLLRQGFNVVPIIAPAVQNKSARLRFFLNADHRVEQIDAAIAATASLIKASYDVSY